MKKTFLMCPPEYYNVNYEINPWMNGNINKVDTDLAKKQWAELYHVINKYANIQILQPIEGLPDMVFTANAGAFFNGSFFVSTFRYPQRQMETSYFYRWALDNGYVVDSCFAPFEGAGDFLFSGINDVYFLGTEKRSDIDCMRDLLQSSTSKIYPIKLVNDNFYHLDTCFCPLDNVLMMHRPAIDSDSWSYINFLYEGNIINVDDKDAKLFACNAVNIDGELIVPAGVSKDLKKSLNKYGYNIHEVNLSEFIKSGGAAKCLTLQLN